VPHRDSHLPPRTRRILHLDVDAFLASVEQAVHPELRGRPVVVGGMPNDRNLVMSCSYETRTHGVRPGMFLGEAARRCPDAIFRRGDSQAANRLREEVVRRLLAFTPRVEVVSIDDFLVDLTGTARLHGSAWDAAQAMARVIREEVHLPITIGIATNVTLARIVGKVAKETSPRPPGSAPRGLAEILPGHERAFLDGLPVPRLPGVGHATQRLLERFAIRTVGDLSQVSREVLFASFGAHGLVLYERARGIDQRPVDPTHEIAGGALLTIRPPRSIRRDSTFEPEEGNRERVEAMLAWLIERSAHRLRGHGLQAGSLEVRLNHVDTRPSGTRRATQDEGRRLRRRRKLAVPTDCTEELWLHGRSLLRELHQRRSLVKTVGVTFIGLTPTAGWQGRLFDDKGEGQPGAANRQRDLDRAVDALRERHGFGRILRGSSLSLLGTLPLGPDGFRLRTPSLNQ
jgi:DNA polymerase-4